jgi:hypothetical protein
MTQGTTEAQAQTPSPTDSASGQQEQIKEDPNRKRQAFGQLISQLMPALVPVALSGLAAMAYGLLRGGYSQFYGQYGINPKDVGLSQQEVLLGLLRFCTAQRLPILGPAKVLIALFIFALVWMFTVLYCQQAKWFEKPVTPSKALLAVIVYVVLLLIILVSTSYVVLPNDRKFASKRVDNSRSVHTNELAFLVIDADIASVTWVGSATPPAGFPSQTEKLIYFGHSNNMSVLYDPKSKSAWRIPESLGMVRLQR